MTTLITIVRHIGYKHMVCSTVPLRMRQEVTACHTPHAFDINDITP
mgnify:CR=1 FL=1